MALALLATGILGCSSEDRSAEVSSSVDRGGDLSNPPLDPPYLTDLKEGSDDGVAMRFGEPRQGKPAEAQGKPAEAQGDNAPPVHQSDSHAAAGVATGSPGASTASDESAESPKAS